MANNITNITLKTYDEALLKKFRSRVPIDPVTKDPVMNIVYAPVDLAFEYAMKRKQIDKSVQYYNDIATDSSNQIVLPMISIYRNNGFKISNMSHEILGLREALFYVRYIDKDSKESKMREIQRLFVDVPYQMDIWTSSEEDMAEVLQSMLFLLKREQALDVQQVIPGIILPDGTPADINYILKITLDNNVEDNTELESESELGKLYRYTLTFMVEDAILVRDAKLPYITTTRVTTEYSNKDDKISLVVEQDIKED